MRVSSPLLPHLRDKNDETEVRKLALDLTDMINRANDGKFGDVPAGNYSEFLPTGELVMNGEATVWRDMITSVVSARVGGTAPTFAAITGGIYGYRFDAARNDEVMIEMEMQHDYEEGTDMDFHVHWSPTTTNTGNIIWGVEYCIRNIGGLFTATTTATKTVAAPGVVGKHVLTDIVTIPGGGLKIGAVIIARVYRSGGTDTFTGNAFLHSVGIHYRVNTIGSRQELVK